MDEFYNLRLSLNGAISVSCLPAVKQLQVNPLCRAAFRKEDSVIHAHTLSAVATQLELQTRENVRTIVEKLVQGMWFHSTFARLTVADQNLLGRVLQAFGRQLVLLVSARQRQVS